MGYYTNYYLEIENEDNFDPNIKMQIIEALVCLSDEFDRTDVAYAAIARDPFEVICYDSRKWYDYEDDMCAVSARFPECKFILEGNGEDPEDIWRMYFFNGHAQYAPARIVYPEPMWDELYSCDV